MKTTTELIEEKGLTVDCFDELDEVIETLETNLTRFREISETITDRMKPHIKYVSQAPFYRYDIRKFEDQLEGTKRDFESKIEWAIHEKFPTLEFDSGDYKTFLETQEKFSARAIMFYFFEKYGQDEELIRLTQIQNSVKAALPEGNIEYSGKKGIKINVRVCWGEEINDVPEIKEFASVIFGGVKPTSTIGFTNRVYGGHDYYCGYLDKIKFYKNGKAVIYFNTEQDCKKFAEALFTDPTEILKQIEA